MPFSISAGVLSVVLAAAGGVQDPLTPAGAGSLTPAARSAAVLAQAADETTTVAEAGGHEVVVTESDLLTILDESHPAMAAGSAELQRARSQLLAAGELENPVLGFSREDLGAPAEQTEWTLSWQLPDADRGPRLDAHRHELEAHAARLEQDRLEIRLRLKESFAEWAFAAARLDLLTAQAERVAGLADREAERARAGEASGLQARRLRLTADRIWIESELSAAEVARARSAVLGWHPDLPTLGRPMLPELPAVPTAVQAHPRVRAASQELEAARLEQRAADRLIRSPELTVGWLREQSEFSTEDGPTVGLSWSVPLFNRRSARKAGAEARVAEGLARLETTRRQVSSARRGHAVAYERLRAATGRAQSGLAEVKPMLDAAEAAFQLGETSLTDLLETYRSADESQLAYLELYRQALAALRRLERATGAGAHLQSSIFERDTP